MFKSYKVSTTDNVLFLIFSTFLHFFLYRLTKTLPSLIYSEAPLIKIVETSKEKSCSETKTNKGIRNLCNLV